VFNTVLVVGVDGQVGGPLADHLQSQGVNVLGTTRRKDRVENGRVYLDLAEPEENWPALPDVETAILCASVTRLETCENDPTGTAKVNVDGVVALARKLAARGTHILYLSTTGVFDFTEPFSRDDIRASESIRGKTNFVFGRHGFCLAIDKGHRPLDAVVAKMVGNTWPKQSDQRFSRYDDCAHYNGFRQFYDQENMQQQGVWHFSCFRRCRSCLYGVGGTFRAGNGK
jgi:NAD(P)-dependent dehydrogenase (short-subunit alcohol dehydrogenase family)